MSPWLGGSFRTAWPLRICIAAAVASCSCHRGSSHQTKLDKLRQGQAGHGAVLPQQSDDSGQRSATNKSASLGQLVIASKQDHINRMVEERDQDTHGQSRHTAQAQDPRRWLHPGAANHNEHWRDAIASPVTLVQSGNGSAKDGGSKTAHPEDGAAPDKVAQVGAAQDSKKEEPGYEQHATGSEKGLKKHENAVAIPSEAGDVQPNKTVGNAQPNQAAGDAQPNTTSDGVKDEEDSGAHLGNLFTLAHNIEKQFTKKGKKASAKEFAGAAEFTGVKKNSEKDLDAIIKAIMFSTFCSVGCVIAFLLLSRFLPAVYAHRIDPTCEDDFDSNLPEPSLCSLVSWGQTAMSVRDEYVIKTVGLDGFMLGELHILCQRILQVIAPIAILILCPLHLFLGARDMPGKQKGVRIPMDILSRCGIDAVTNTWLSSPDSSGSNLEVFEGQLLCWAHVAMVWFVVFFTVRMIFRAQYRFLRYRFQWLKDMPAPRSTTLMVENIPQEQRSDEALHAYFSRLFSDHAVERAYVVKRTKKLQALVHREEALNCQLLQAQAQLEARRRDGETPGVLDSIGDFLSRTPGSQESLHVLAEKVEQAREAVEAERISIEARARLMDKSVCSSSGFVTFTTRRWKRLASREQLKADASLLTMQTPPDPNDVRYEDLAWDPSLQATNNMIANFLVFLIFMSWLPLTIALTGLTQLEELMSYKAFFWLQPLKQERFAFLKSTLEGICSTLALKVVLAFLPSILVAIIYNFRTLKSGNLVQLSLQNRYFMFLLVFVVLVSGINMTLIHSLADIVENPNNIFVLFSRLPSSSNFYISYVVLGWFTITMNLLRIAPVIKYLIFYWSGLSPQDARNHAEPEDQDSDGMGSRMAKATIMMTIALVFSTCSPTIPTAALVYFILGARVSRWNVLYAETKKPDLGGAFWVLSLKHIFASLGIYVLLMCAIMLKARWGNGLPAAGIFLCGLALMYSYWSFEQIVWETLPFEEIAEADIEDRKRTLISGAVGLEQVGEYWQVELGKMSTGRADENVDPGLVDQTEQPSVSASSTQRWSLSKASAGIA
mmetsp:Transcript_124751/g.313760  ORF Transcript_124751/g.313760 Transcript_124751/m.313760 type:complete len:1058 (+) Transcript_124751:131-3304(+)